MYQTNAANKMRILNLVHEHRCISRTDLAKTTDLSVAAVSRIVQHLMEEGYLVETGYGDSAGGRRPVNIELKSDAGYIIGVDFERSRARAAVFDFCGEEKFYYKAVIQNNDYFAGLYEAVDACVKCLRANGWNDRLLGIGLGVRGLLDVASGTILYSSSFSWGNVPLPLRQILEDRYGVPVFMDINARLAALSEWSLVYRRSVSDLSYVTASWGVCAGIIANNRIFRGGCDGAGEIGNSFISADLASGSMKKLEELCGGQMFLREAQQHWEHPDCTTLREACGNDLEQLTLDRMVEASQAGDKFCLELAARGGRVLGIGLANLAVSFDPQIIVLGGTLMELGDAYLKPATEVLMESLVPEERSRLKLAKSMLGTRASMTGASLLVFQSLFPNPYGPELADESTAWSRSDVAETLTR